MGLNDQYRGRALRVSEPLLFPGARKLIPFIKSNLRREFESTIEIKLEQPNSIIILCDTTALCKASNF